MRKVINVTLQCKLLQQWCIIQYCCVIHNTGGKKQSVKTQKISEHHSLVILPVVKFKNLSKLYRHILYFTHFPNNRHTTSINQLCPPLDAKEVSEVINHSDHQHANDGPERSTCRPQSHRRLSSPCLIWWGHVKGTPGSNTISSLRGGVVSISGAIWAHDLLHLFS